MVNMREGKVPSQKPRSVRKLVNNVFNQSLTFLHGGLVGGMGEGVRVHALRDCIGGQGVILDLYNVPLLAEASARRRLNYKT